MVVLVCWYCRNYSNFRVKTQNCLDTLMSNCDQTRPNCTKHPTLNDVPRMTLMRARLRMKSPQVLLLVGMVVVVILASAGVRSATALSEVWVAPTGHASGVDAAGCGNMTGVGPCATIAYAVDQCDVGGTVILMSGLHSASGNATANKTNCGTEYDGVPLTKALTVTSPHPPHSATVTGQECGRCFIISGASVAASTVLRDITCTLGYHRGGGGLLITGGASPTIVNVNVINSTASPLPNTALDNRGGGVRICTQAAVNTVLACDVSNGGTLTLTPHSGCAHGPREWHLTTLCQLHLPQLHLVQRAVRCTHPTRCMLPLDQSNKNTLSHVARVCDRVFV